MKAIFLILDDEASLSEIYEELEDLFDQIKDNKLEQSFDLTINTGNRILSEEAKTDLTQKKLQSRQTLWSNNFLSM